MMNRRTPQKSYLTDVTRGGVHAESWSKVYLISAGLQPGDAQNAHFHLFRRAGAAEEAG